MIPVVLKMLSKAAKERRRVAIRYDGQNHLRVVEPHVIYLDDQGNVMADCHQVKGYSSTGKPVPFWKTFRVTKIDAVFLLDDAFKADNVEGFRLGKQDYPAGLIATAYDRPPALLRRNVPHPDNLIGHTRHLWAQFESVLDGFLSDEAKPHGSQ